MRRFEYSDAKSSKFWEVTVVGTEVTTQWGRIGANGQTKTKTFASAADAEKEADKQIRAKSEESGAFGVDGENPPTDWAAEDAEAVLAHDAWLHGAP